MKDSSSFPIATLGHSTRQVTEFLGILNAFSIGTVIDIRTVPRSRHNPQYERSEFSRWLAEAGYKYQHQPALGGLRRPHKDSPNTGWRNTSFRGYADYMQTSDFQTALEEVIETAHRERLVLVCAEAVPWRCHRSLVADALGIRGVQVIHIYSATSVKPHVITPWAHVEGTQIIYPERAEAPISKEMTTDYA